MTKQLSLSVLVALFYVPLLMQAASPACAAGKFLVFDYSEVRKKHSSWSAADQQRLQEELAGFVDNNRHEIDLNNVTYLIIPSRSNRMGFLRTWAVLKDSSGGSTKKDLFHFQQVSAFTDFLEFLWQLHEAGAISEANDAVVLDDQDISDLLRLAWFNRESTSDSPVALNAKLFDLQFVQSESRGWFLASPSGRRLLFVKGLTSYPLSTAYLCLPDHKGQTPFFEVASGDRAILMKALEGLRSEWIPATLTVNLKFAGIGHLPAELAELEESVEVQFKDDERAEVLQRHKLEGDTLKLEFNVRRRVLASTTLSLILRRSDFQILDIDHSRFSDTATFKIPEPHEMLHAGAGFDLWVAKVGRAQGFQSHSLWSSSAYIDDLQILFDLPSLLARRRSQVGQRTTIATLFESPKEFLSSLDPGSDPLRKRHREKEDREVLETIAGTKDVREALWRHVMIGLDRAIKPSQILLIKNVGGPTTSIETRDNANRYFSLLRLFLESKLQVTGHSDVQLLTSERRAADSHQIGAVDVIVFSLDDP